ncbi:hypothetical protein KAFR_0B03900 [Kazachstania africana CBS 2517]|uniref:Ubiquitin-like domain-containing protein n=1 Tax=Kazachstania africana (strain ATCC 22294 / BCRC 22015 / CBS 2517 / CECT 1963 / NBRC 1671 / NRRL Y-8276) TaxID=1071382 RepID=H2AQN6_KAZAF|nr:hypothetical protein KAFR_0B03900 [Kazachstania africana CBS 2517]CCF56686.1 hypothetical protein KAFR_0B03900 [Kazachstania africana CBS 2517]
MSITIHIKSGQNKWDVNTNLSDSIATLKEEISKISEIPATNQRLIYSGKILKDDQTVESYKIEEGHSIHLVKSGGNVARNSAATNTTPTATSNENTNSAPSVPSNIASGQTGGFNPLNDLTSARYAGYLNMPSADMFGPDGGLNSGPSQDDMLRMLDNPVFQSQMNEMLSNPQMIDFMIQSNPQLQAMGPQARQMLQSPMFRQMLINPDMIRQSMQFARMMNGGNDPAATGNDPSAFPAPGEASASTNEQNTNASGESTTAGGATNNTNSTSAPAAANPFDALFNPAANPFGAMSSNTNGSQPQQPAFDPALLASMLGMPQSQQTPAQQDNRPPEERYEAQLRQLNDMGFFDFDRNVAALRRSGGSVQGALDALLNGDV